MNEVLFFTHRVMKHFGFLESEYGFKVTTVINSDIHPQTDGLVKYASDTTLILIGSEFGDATLRFCRVVDDERYYLDPVFVNEYMTISENEKRILLSRDMNDVESANAIFRKAFLFSSDQWKDSSDNVIQNLEKRLMNYSQWLKNNAAICLLGDFSLWPALYEYKINRLMADELRRGGKETVLAVVKDENGKYKQIERPIFQREKDHLTRLRKGIIGS